jgi:sarcosine oxidase subunit alpha
MRLPHPRFAPDCEIRFDGRRIPARRGESVACALLAAGRPLLARSPKYHRPRGPFCLAGSCGSCLVRAGGLPNQRACRVACRDGLAVESQNAFPRAGHDLLSVVDRVYAHGLDVHHLMTWNGLANRAAVAFSRRLAGLGRLPARTEEPAPAAIEERFDALVVGAGPAGLGAAEVLAAAGRRVLVVDEERAPGGRLRCRLDLPGDPPPRWAEEVAGVVRRAGGALELGATAAGFWRDGGPVVGVLAEGGRLRLVRAHRLVIAAGAHPQPPAFEDSDLPGVLAARGLVAALAEHGVVPGARAVVVGDGDEAEAVVARLAAAGMEVARADAPRAAHGRRRVAALVLGDGRRLACDTVAVVGDGTPAADLARAAGASLQLDARTGVIRLASAGPHVAPGVLAAGEVLGPMRAAAAADSGRRAGEAALG